MISLVSGAPGLVFSQIRHYRARILLLDLGRDVSLACHDRKFLNSGLNPAIEYGPRCGPCDEGGGSVVLAGTRLPPSSTQQKEAGRTHLLRVDDQLTPRSSHPLWGELILLLQHSTELVS